MKTTRTILAGALAMTAMTSMTAMLPLLMTPAMAYAQQAGATQGTPRIEGFNVAEVKRMGPGAELNFDLYGTPGGSATLRIDGATRNVPMVETEAGHYEGSYTVSSRDKIAARSPVTANLRIGNQIASMVLDESLQTGVGYHAVNAAPGPQLKIERFNVEPVASLGGGNDLQFSMAGTPGAKVDLVISGVKARVFMPEVSSGEYATTYTIRNNDRIARNSVVTANLRLGDRVTNATLDKALQTGEARASVARICYICGTVEAVNLVEVKGEGSYLGTIGGGVVGALLGNQVGGGRGRTAAQIGGAYAGNMIEGKARNTTHYEILVRLQNGATQMVPFATDPGYRVGEKVKVDAGVITRTS
jgi:outer membrane lipoprotein SlyB